MVLRGIDIARRRDGYDTGRNRKPSKAVSRTLNNLGSREKIIGLEEAARALLEGEEEILAANQAIMKRQKTAA